MRKLAPLLLLEVLLSMLSMVTCNVSLSAAPQNGQTLFNRPACVALQNLVRMYAVASAG